MSEVITSIEEAIVELRPKLFTYLNKKIGITNNKKPFHCPFHDDTGRPNMQLNVKSNYEVAHCFSCNTSADIFKFASKLENLPAHGTEWVTITIPALCEQLGLKLNLGAQTETSKLKSQYYKLANEINDILIHSDQSYMAERGWAGHKTNGGSIHLDIVLEKLLAIGYDLKFIEESRLLGWENKTKGKFVSLFDNDLYTWSIKDQYNRTIGFIARHINYDKEKHDEKYIHSLNGLLFDKSRVLFGLDIALHNSPDKNVYIVEGTSDLEALHNINVFNVVACLGTAVTETQLLELKKAGIRKVILALNSDEAGQNATERVVENVFTRVQDINYYIKSNLPDGFKDFDEFVKSGKTRADFNSIKELSLFEYKINQNKNLSSEELCKLVLPIIATEPSAIKRSLMTKSLAELTGLEYAAVEVDIESLRNQEVGEKRNALKAAAQDFQLRIDKEPDNLPSLISSFEEEIEKIEKRYQKSVVGVNYQIQRFEAIQELRNLSDENADAAMFNFKHFSELKSNLSGGMPITRSCLIYAGGRANSGKTLSCLAIGSDIALHDDKAMVLIHTIDDSYDQIEPRLTTNLYNMYYGHETRLTLDMVISPWKYKHNDDIVKAIKKGTELFKDLLSEERICIFDAADGANLSLLERQIRYYKNRYPDKKMMTICDNTFDYQDYIDLDQTSRMKMISTQQKRIVNKYNICMLATVEYRKAPPQANKTMVLPTNDDIADSRSMSYKPNIIFHVYNDLADRANEAEIFHLDPKTKKKLPRLLWCFTKNKINSFKDWMVVDIDPATVSARPKNISEASQEVEDMINNKTLPKEAQREMDELDNQFEIETDYEEF